MTELQQLIGSYSAKGQVLVRGKECIEHLKCLGSFGTQLISAKRKDSDRRGPVDRRLLDITHEDESEEYLTYLSLHETFFLVHALTCMNITNSAGGSMTSDECWLEFRSFYSKSISHLDFAVQYGVYYYFRTLGWVVKDGENYGSTFLLYKDGPAVDHAQCTVIIIYEPKDSRVRYNWQSLLTFHRVSQSVKKELLLAFVTFTDCMNESTILDKPDCINHMKLLVKSFNVQSNTIDRSQAR